jgi:hypothetical protein
MDTGLEALAGSRGTSPAKASSPCWFLYIAGFFIIHYSLSTINEFANHY